MKKLEFSLVFSFLAFAAAILLSYCDFSIAEGDKNDYMVGIGSFLCYAITFIPMIGIKHQHSGINVNLRVLSVLFALIMLVSNFTFAGLGVIMPYYVVVNGIISILYLVIYLNIADADVKHG